MQGDTTMRQPELTEEEMDLAMAVHDHNVREQGRHADLILAVHYLLIELKIDVPGFESKDADGRLTFDPGAVERHVASMPEKEARALLSESRVAPRELSAMMDVGLSALRRVNVLTTETLVRGLAETDDIEEVTEIRDALAEDRDEVESLGRHWQQDPVNVVWHTAYTERLAACDARIAELSPSPAP